MSASSRSETVRKTFAANGDSVTLPLNGLPAVGLTITGTWTGTLQVEQTFDGDTWSNAKVLTEADVAVSLPLTANQIGLIKGQGRAAVRVRASAAMTGSAVVVLNATEGLVTAGTGGGPVTIADGADTALGTTTDAAVTGDGAGTLNAHLRGLTKAMGDPTDAAVGDATGTLLAKVRQIAKSLAGALTVSGTVTVNSGGGNFASTLADGANVTMGAEADAAAGTDTATASYMALFKRLLQRVTVLIGQLPASLVNNRLDVNVGAAPSLISTANSTVTPLIANAVFTGTGEDVSGYSTISLGVFTDQASASSGLSLQFSEDNSNWDFSESYTQAITAAGAGNNYYTRPRAKFFRIVYTNGGTNQGTFRLQTVYHQADQNNAPSGLQTDLRFSPSVPGTVVMLYDAGVPRFGMQAAAKVLADGDTGSRTAAAHFQWFNGATYDRARTPLVFKTIAAVAVTAATPVTVWTPTTGKKFRLMGYSLSLSVAGSVILDDSAAEMIRTPLMAAGIGLNAPPMGNGILSALANNALKVDVSSTGAVSGYVYGTEE